MYLKYVLVFPNLLIVSSDSSRDPLEMSQPKTTA